MNSGIMKKIKRYRLSYLMLLPGFMFTFIFAYAPMYGLYIAFADYKLGKPLLQSRFVGFENFIDFFKDSMDFPYLLRNTICMNILAVVIGLLASLTLAIMLNEVRCRAFKRIVQTASFFPFFISWVIVYNIFNTFLAVNSGVLNMILVDLGIFKEGVNFLGEPKYAWGLFIFSSMWKTLGYSAVIFLASISSINNDLYEAAEIDGADRIQKIWYITVPMLLPTAQVLLILNAGTIFNSNFDQYYLFTNGMNREMMEVFDMYIYRLGIVNLNYSYTTAVGMAKSIAGFALMLTVNSLSKRMSGRGII